MPPAQQSMPPLATLKKELRRSIREQRSRGLMHSSKHLGELLVGLPQQHLAQSFSSSSRASSSFIAGQHVDLANSRMSFERDSSFSDLDDDGMLDDLQDAFEFAKSLFELKEYLRCAHALSQQLEFWENQLPVIKQQQHESVYERILSVFQRCFFLRCYALFLAGEKRKEEEIIELYGALERVSARDSVDNRQVRQLRNDLCRIRDTARLDGYLFYLLALLEKEMDQLDDCIDCLEWSVVLEPSLWCAWLLLAKLRQNGPGDPIQPRTQSIRHNEQQSLMYRTMYDFFLIEYYLQCHDPGRALQILSNSQLVTVFRQSTYVEGQHALIRYSLNDYNTAGRILEELYDKKDPYRFDQIDLYSNILYVFQKPNELAMLVDQLLVKDKYRPATCCAIGNLYSLKGAHDKAITNFKRALKLDRKFFSAWTLMGHEYLELGNSAAAVHSYRTAVEINPRDFRAWYGLGQVYEFLNMHAYAVYYFNQAVKLRPHDTRLWLGLGNCYERIGTGNHIQEAIRCYDQARRNGDRSSILKLAELHRRLNQPQVAVMFYEQYVQQRGLASLMRQSANQDGAQQASADAVLRDMPLPDLAQVARALLCIANYYATQRRNLSDAIQCCSSIIDNPAFNLEELQEHRIMAADMLGQIRPASKLKGFAPGNTT